MVLIPGGSTPIGSTEKEVEALGQADKDLFFSTVCETPQHVVAVGDFFLMVNEVSNEQYAAFVRATGRCPPEHWAGPAIDAAQAAHMEDLERLRREAVLQGKPAPESAPFARSEWWRKNRPAHTVEGRDWKLPEGLEILPVVYVDFEDAQAYARWAGVRLMTEQEFQRAGRGKEGRSYPWGDDFDSSRCTTTSARVEQPRPVGSLPLGATSEGVFELCGNVWEWTTSPFLPYPGWKPLKLKLGKGRQARVLDGLVDWEEQDRVAVSGSFQAPDLAARLTTRRRGNPLQSTDSLGFRCAAGVVPGADAAQDVLRYAAPADQRPKGVEFDPAKVLAAERWRSTPGRAGIPGYALIEGYDHLLYVPVFGLELSAAKQLVDLSHARGPVPLGILSLSLDALEPPLPRGVYLVSYLAKAAPSADGGAPGGGGTPPESELPAGTDRGRDNLLFSRPGGAVVAVQPLDRLEFVRPREPRIELGPLTPAAPELGEPADAAPAAVARDRAVLDVNTWVRVANKGFNYDIVLEFEQDALGTGWRH